jgi:hypothetical protein
MDDVEASNSLDIALALAAAGLPVFPCKGSPADLFKTAR